MQILVVGGTQFVGRHIVEAALARGHGVTVLHRGLTGAGLFEDCEHLLADRNFLLGMTRALGGRSFDATIDSSAYFPAQVATLAAAMPDNAGGHYVQVSSVAAYEQPAGPGATETTPLLRPRRADLDGEVINADTYGPLKALTETAALECFSKDRVTVVRPGYIVGPFDNTGRFPWWVQRISRGGPMACPGPEQAPMQLVDARDLANWVVTLIEAELRGAFHACAPQPPWSLADMINGIADVVGPADFEPLWVDAAAVGEATFPFWAKGEPDFVSALDATAALSTGLQPRPFADTVAETFAWMQQQEWRVAGVGISEPDERALLKALASFQSADL